MLNAVRDAQAFTWWLVQIADSSGINSRILP